MLTLTNIVKRFGDTPAVDGVSLRVAPGEIVGLLGPNGAGKTTTINMIAGLLAPDDGGVDVGGLGSPLNPRARMKLGLATQELALYEPLNAGENLRFFGRLYGLHGKNLRTRVDETLNLVGLLDRREHTVATFSGGMKRRLNLAIALMHEPTLLLLDEPTAGVDPQSRAAILEVVRDLARTGKAVVYTTHYMEEAAKICDRVAIMDHGKVLAVGSVPELVAQHGGASVVTVVDDTGTEHVTHAHEPLAVVTKAVQHAGTRNIRIDRPDLETVFLAMTGRKLRD